MSESLDRAIEVPELTADEIQARVLHRDGLMLVIDKPAGLPVHRGPKGGANLEVLVRRAAVRAAASAGSCPSARPRYFRLPGAGTPSQGDGVAGPVVQARQNFKDLLGGGRGRPGRGRGHHRHAARPAQRRARLVAETRPGRPASHHQLESAGAFCHRPGGRNNQLTWLALEPVTGRTHQLRVHAAAMGWPIVGDNIYGNGPRFGEPRLHLHSREIVMPDLEEQGPGPRRRPGAGAFARAAQGMRMERRVKPLQGVHTAARYHGRRRRIERAWRTEAPGQAGQRQSEISLAPSCPVMTSGCTVPGVSPAIATGTKCSVRPCVALSISTCRVAPTSDASRRCKAASPVARSRLARCLICLPRNLRHARRRRARTRRIGKHVQEGQVALLDQIAASARTSPRSRSGSRR